MKNLLNKTVFIILVIAIQNIPLIATYTLQLQDIIFLKNGTEIHGVIVEMIPGSSLIIRDESGTLQTIQIMEIIKFGKKKITQESMNPGAVRSYGMTFKPGACKISTSGMYSILRYKKSNWEDLRDFKSSVIQGNLSFSLFAISGLAGGVSINYARIMDRGFRAVDFIEYGPHLEWYLNILPYFKPYLGAALLFSKSLSPQYIYQIGSSRTYDFYIGLPVFITRNLAIEQAVHYAISRVTGELRFGDTDYFRNLNFQTAEFSMHLGLSFFLQK